MLNLKKWHAILAAALAALAMVAKAADYVDSRIDARIQVVAVPKEDFKRLEDKLDRITDILIKPKSP